MFLNNRNCPEFSDEATFNNYHETILRDTAELYARISVEVPSIEEFSRAGVDSAMLDDVIQRLDALEDSAVQDGTLISNSGHGLKPELVFAPVLSIDKWQALYKSLEDDLRVNRDSGRFLTEDELKTNPEEEDLVVKVEKIGL